MMLSAGTQPETAKQKSCSEVQKIQHQRALKDLLRKPRVRMCSRVGSLPLKIIFLQRLACRRGFCSPAEWHWAKPQCGFSFELVPDHVTASLIHSHKQLLPAEVECWKELFPSLCFWFLNLGEVLCGILMSRQAESGLSESSVRDGLCRKNRQKDAWNRTFLPFLWPALLATC